MADLNEMAETLRQCQMEGRLDDALGVALDMLKAAPENGEICTAAGSLSLVLGHFDQALKIFGDGMRAAPQDLYLRNNFLKLLFQTGFDRYDENIKNWLTIFLGDALSNNVALISRLWLTTLVHDPAYAALFRMSGSADYPAFAAWLSPQGKTLKPLLAAPFFLNGVRVCVIADIGVEKLLVYLRYWLLDLAAAEAPPPSWTFKLAVALGEQSFLNEFVFDEIPAESAALQILAERIAGKNFSAFDVAVFGAYRPLAAWPEIVRLAAAKNAFPAPDRAALESLFRRQIDEPAREQKIKRKIRSIGKISDTVSQKVQAQYEENPYPRWISNGRVPEPEDQMVPDDRLRVAPVEILVAGCATGHFPIRVAMNYPYGWVTGIDLSLASLAYGTRKAEEMEIENIELIHCDILDAGALKKKFDIIFSVGVLHHMNDPEQGWRALVNTLKPGGLMKIGLYPRHERRHITDGRAYIAANGIPDTIEGIRHMRRYVVELPADHPLKKVMPFNDFYSTSMMRDLLFHVQEETFTIPRIKKDIADLGLEFLGFPLIFPPQAEQYHAMFPDDPAMRNLDHWDEFERQYPDTFTGMYQFWCRKLAA